MIVDGWLELVIPRGVGNPLQYSQRRAAAASAKAGLRLEEFAVLAKFESEPFRVLYKPIGQTGFGSYC
jgi:hypothetical protein